MSFLIAIGVDIAKLKFDVACLVAGKYKHKTFTNDTPGHAAFATWLVALCGDVKPLICMEATGSYGLPLADFLTHQGHAVSCVGWAGFFCPPFIIQAFEIYGGQKSMCPPLYLDSELS